MAAWKEETKAKTVEMLKGAVDIRFLKNELIVLLVLFAFFALAPIWFARNDPGYWGYLMWLVAVIPLSFGIYCASRLIRIFRKAESYVFCKTVLDRPHYSNFHGRMYFVVVAEDLNGRKFQADTAAVFHPGGYIPPLVEEYVNKTVTVGYNEETGVLVVVE